METDIRDQAVEALIEILDGNGVVDLQAWTGLSFERCKEIFELFKILTK